MKYVWLSIYSEAVNWKNCQMANYEHDKINPNEINKIFSFVFFISVDKP